MKRTFLSLAATLVLVSCNKPSALSKQALVGKWTLTEVETQQGHRGPPTGIVVGELELAADGTSTERLPWATLSGSWSLSDGVLIRCMTTNAPATKAKVWFDGKLLAVEPEDPLRMTFYYSKAR